MSRALAFGVGVLTGIGVVVLLAVAGAADRHRPDERIHYHDPDWARR